MKDMDDGVPVVHSDPVACVLAFYGEGDNFHSLAQFRFHGISDGDRLTVVVPGADEVVFANVGLPRYIQKNDVCRFLFQRSLFRKFSDFDFQCDPL